MNVSFELFAKIGCSTCHGEGVVNQSQQDCPTCHGKGVIERRVSLQEALAAILIPPTTGGDGA